MFLCSRALLNLMNRFDLLNNNGNFLLLMGFWYQFYKISPGLLHTPLTNCLTICHTDTCIFSLLLSPPVLMHAYGVLISFIIHLSVHFSVCLYLWKLLLNYFVQQHSGTCDGEAILSRKHSCFLYFWFTVTFLSLQFPSLLGMTKPWRCRTPRVAGAGRDEGHGCQGQPRAGRQGDDLDSHSSDLSQHNRSTLQGQFSFLSLNFNFFMERMWFCQHLIMIHSQKGSVTIYCKSTKFHVLLHFANFVVRYQLYWVMVRKVL